MGGAAVVGAEGAAGLMANPAAMPGDSRMTWEASGLPGLDEFTGDGYIVGQTMVWWSDSWGFYYDFQTEKYDDPVLGDDDGNPRRSRGHVGLNLEAARLLGLDPGRWQFRLGAASSAVDIRAGSGRERSICDADLGLLIRPRRPFGATEHLGWRAGLVVRNLVGLVGRPHPARSSDITGAVGLEFAVYGRDEVPEVLHRDPDRIPPGSSFRPRHDRRLRRFDVVVSAEFTAYHDSPHRPAYRLGMEASLGGILFARAGWCDETRGWGHGVSWGTGVDFKLWDDWRIRLDYARAPMRTGGIVDETVNAWTFSWRGWFPESPGSYW